MNILVFSWRDPKHPLAGGAEQVMHEHMKGWVKAGHKVTLFSSKMKNLSSEEGIDNIHIVRQGNQYLGVQLAGFFYYLKNRKKFDLVVDQFHGLPFFTPFYVRKQKLAIIQEVARQVWFLNPLPWPLNWLIGVMGYLGEPFIFLFYKQSLLPWSKNVPFITGSLSAKNDVNKMGIPMQNISVIPHGVILPKSKVVSKKSKVKTIIYLGVLSKDKGIEDALKCFSILNKKGIFNFWIIGKPETTNYGFYLQRLVKKLKIKNKIKFLGYVSQEKKFELLSKAHVLINPSIHEGWGLVNIEANAFGVPVVAYHVSGSVDSVKNGISGLLVRQKDITAMVKAVLQLISDEVFYKKFQNGAYKWSKIFSWNHSRALSLKVIERISNGS